MRICQRLKWMVPRVKRGMTRKISKNKTVEPSKMSKNETVKPSKISKNKRVEASKKSKIKQLSHQVIQNTKVSTYAIFIAYYNVQC